MTPAEKDGDRRLRMLELQVRRLKVLMQMIDPIRLPVADKEPAEGAD